ncbi:ankyrin repeat domain-containing protein [Ferribacterium limneticum]|uniref:ankyrin repeat domain-containing protein n=1 Tax=Ferribacterium limneticum TaxID=76259 RepID=UPI001CF817D4|nr:ankyrin repeat domain-containing protein [Ferribacterium limneticum]UCV21860.1 ankyrin repeat domain-containing protein [Ferribacterium limneticum]
MGFLLSASAPVFSADALPDPVAFTVRMELGDVGQAESWLDAGLPPDFMGSRIGSGLMIGAWEGKPDLMRLFLARGADINKLNSNGESAIALAAWRGNLEMVKWLIERGARINAPARQWSALHYAVFAGHTEVADFLIDQGADINALSTNGSSVLMMAVYEGHQGLARKLIEKGADRTPKNDWGDGALEWAMRHDRLELARMVTNPEEFNIAVSQPKEKWGAPVRSMRSSKELEELLSMREKLVERSMSTNVIDKRIATERVRIVRAEMDRPMPARAVTMEITASRKKPQEQSATIIVDEKGKGKAVGFKAPPATYFGTPKMPIKAPVRNY